MELLLSLKPSLDSNNVSNILETLILQLHCPHFAFHVSSQLSHKLRPLAGPAVWKIKNAFEQNKKQVAYGIEAH